MHRDRLILNPSRRLEITSGRLQGKPVFSLSNQVPSLYLSGLRRDAFKQNALLDKKDFAAIEYLLRKGQRQLEIYSVPDIKNIMR